MKQQEHFEQTMFFAWADMNAYRLPELGLMLAIPNGGHRHIAVARKLKAEGVKAGVPDIFLPVSRGQHHGMWIEMKADKGKTTESQNRWISRLREQGYHVVVTHGLSEAIDAVQKYLATEPQKQA